MNHSVSYVLVSDANDKHYVAKFYEESDKNRETMYYKDKVFCSILKSSDILKYKQSFDSEMINLYENCSEDTLLTYMLHERSKTLYTITYIKAIVILDQIVKALCHLHKKKIVHGYVKPSNIVFGVERDINSLKLIGFENASLYEQSKDVDYNFDKSVKCDDIYTKMSIHK